MINSNDHVDAESSYELKTNTAVTEANSDAEAKGEMQSIKWALKPEDYMVFHCISLAGRRIYRLNQHVSQQQERCICTRG